ncbi:TrbG/VirB9 family P-type conjugative transfer protein [Paracraurococcus lichenis]|uniref:TrbG/VirB9 family P-type conjugative transfer protein n=1 Tax=Paracraurococcus lichenis TaxID=3064888 RepID=A0ABT9E9D8_9PROT|nr:TrbG/VirB9 family P-type conjugative transfer protein [Paracraurococcus sp. LOR1-02]MDO9712810.1 TrbG/VirB9 family P-type conjugative transfer protein [Paracraurococcus sp. LOR1-02]
MRCLLLAPAAAILATPALAAIDPPACSVAGDPRVRCAAYDEVQVYRVPARVGAHVTILFAEGSTILDPAGAMIGACKESESPQDCRQRITEWQIVPDANSLQLQVLRNDLASTVMTVPVQMRGGKVLNHLFQLDTAAPNPGKVGAALLSERDEPDEGKRRAANGDTMLLLRFSYTAQQNPPPSPAARAPAETAATPFAATQASNRLAGTLRQEAFYGPHARNWQYIARGDTETQPLEISDNGLDTVVRFDVGLPVPNVYKTETGRCSGAEGEALVTRDTLGPGLFRIHGTYPVLCFRRTPTKATEVRNLGFDPYGANPGTGTISPDIVRTVRRAPRS